MQLLLQDLTGQRVRPCLRCIPLFSIGRVGRQRASQTVFSIRLRRQYEHNVTLTRMDLSAVLWPEVPRGFAYILFDAFKEPVEKGGAPAASSTKYAPPVIDERRRSSLPANIFSSAANASDGRNPRSKASPAAAVRLLSGSGGDSDSSPAVAAERVGQVEARLDRLEMKITAANLEMKLQLDAVLRAVKKDNAGQEGARARPQPIELPGQPTAG